MNLRLATILAVEVNYRVACGAGTGEVVKDVSTIASGMLLQTRYRIYPLLQDSFGKTQNTDSSEPNKLSTSVLVPCSSRAEYSWLYPTMYD